MELTERFAALVSGPEAAIPLDEVALVIAAHASPGLDVAAQLARLDALAAGCSAPTLDAVVKHLFVEEGFAGNRADYGNPSNSLLHHVLDRRLGIPLTLSILTMEVGRRLGVPMAGVGMPGHFLLRDRVDPGLFIDPFDKGRYLDLAGVQRLFHRVRGPEAGFDPAFCEPVGRLTIVARLLGNLGNAYGRRRDRDAVVWVATLRSRLPGAGVEDHERIASALVAGGRFVEAARAYEDAASLAEDTGGSGEALVEKARRLRAMLN